MILIAVLMVMTTVSVYAARIDSRRIHNLAKPSPFDCRGESCPEEDKSSSVHAPGDGGVSTPVLPESMTAGPETLCMFFPDNAICVAIECAKKPSAQCCALLDPSFDMGLLNCVFKPDASCCSKYKSLPSIIGSDSAAAEYLIDKCSLILKCTETQTPECCNLLPNPDSVPGCKCAAAIGGAIMGGDVSAGAAKDVVDECCRSTPDSALCCANNPTRSCCSNFQKTSNIKVVVDGVTVTKTVEYNEIPQCACVVNPEQCDCDAHFGPGCCLLADKNKKRYAICDCLKNPSTECCRAAGLRGIKLEACELLDKCINHPDVQCCDNIRKLYNKGNDEIDFGPDAPGDIKTSCKSIVDCMKHPGEACCKLNPLAPICGLMNAVKECIDNPTENCCNSMIQLRDYMKKNCQKDPTPSCQQEVQDLESRIDICLSMKECADGVKSGNPTNCCAIAGNKVSSVCKIIEDCKDNPGTACCKLAKNEPICQSIKDCIDNPTKSCCEALGERAPPMCQILLNCGITPSPQCCQILQKTGASSGFNNPAICKDMLACVAKPGEQCCKTLKAANASMPSVCNCIITPGPKCCNTLKTANIDIPGCSCIGASTVMDACTCLTNATVGKGKPLGEVPPLIGN